MSNLSVKVALGGHEVDVFRARLGLFLQLERYRQNVSDAIKERHSGDVAVSLFEYLRLATREELEYGALPWHEIITAYINIELLNALPKDLPMLKHPMKGGENRPVPWHHPQRPFIMWIHILATSYGWSLAEIEELWPEDAAAYVQEIATDEQFRKEWEHMLSPIAHPTNKKGKDLFKPLARPSWMATRPRKTKILRKMLPAGTTVDLSGVTLSDTDD